MHRFLVASMAIASLAGPLLAMEKEIKPVILVRDMPQEIKDDTKNILTFIHNNPLVFPKEIQNIIKDELISSNRFILIDLFKDSLIKRSFELKGHTHYIDSVAFSQDGKFALTGSADKTARLWNLKDLSSVELLKVHNGSIWAVDFSGDGNYALVKVCEGAIIVRLWQLLPELTLDQVALIAKLDHLSKSNVNSSFLFIEKNGTENFYEKILKSFDQDRQKAIVSAFKLDPHVLT